MISRYGRDGRPVTAGHTQMYSDFILYFLEIDMLRIKQGTSS